MTTPYTSQRVPKADILSKIVSPLSDIWRRWFSRIDERLYAIEAALGIQPDQSYIWKVDPATGDLYPDGPSPANDAGIGGVNKSPLFVAVGGQAALSNEGFIAGRDPANGGGLQVTGFRAEDPGGAAVVPNASVELRANVVFVSAETVLLEVPAEVTDDRYWIATESNSTPWGKSYSPIVIGPQVIYSLTPEVATDPRDLDVDTQTQRVVSLTLANDYNFPNNTTFTYGVQLDERSSSWSSEFTIEIYVNTTLSFTSVVNLNASTQYISETFTLQNPRVTGDQIHMDVTAIPGHQNSDPWVSGSTRESRLEIKQG